MHRPEGEPVVLDAAARWKERCLLDDGSMLSDGRIWTLENLAQLDRFFVQNLDMGAGTFWEKLEAQLEPASPGAKKLGAEMFWLMYLIVSSDSMSAETKRVQIRRVWEWSGAPLPDSADMKDILDHGVANPGTSYNTHRWREFKFLIELIRDLKQLRREQLEALLSEPWEFGEWLDNHPGSPGRQLRHVLPYLLFPSHYEPIVTGRHKRAIVRAFRERYELDPDAVDYKSRIAVDRALHEVRDHIASEFGNRDLHPYQEPLVAIWRDEPTTEQKQSAKPSELAQWYRATFGDARTWVIGAGRGARAWGEFQREGIIAIGWDYLGDLSDYKSREEIQAAMLEELGEGANPTNNSLACWQFAHDMQPGDYVIAKKGGSVLLGWGRVKSDYRHEEGRSEYDHVRSVEWRNIGPWKLPENQKIASKTLTEFTHNLEWLKFAWEFVHGTELPEPDPPDEKYSLSTAAAGLFMGEDKLQRILDTLGRRMNIILQGPPGVGKTFVARRLAYALIKYVRPSQVEMVQFHQSYAYEDFVQGWRPAASGGFERHDGVFYRFCQKAAADPGNNYVFIIDEINRGNLSKVFGELMMLIEADKRGSGYAVRLTYSPESSFSVPPNLYVIGMMNTADRSLAMVDYALRRRFGFVHLDPAFDSDAFSETLAQAGADDALIGRIVERLGRLNDEIRQDKNLGAGFEIGHSYFVPGDSDESIDYSWYQAVVDHEIRPLLEEYWFDEPQRVDKAVRDLIQ